MAAKDRLQTVVLLSLLLALASCKPAVDTALHPTGLLDVTLLHQDFSHVRTKRHADDVMPDTLHFRLTSGDLVRHVRLKRSSFEVNDFPVYTIQNGVVVKENLMPITDAALYVERTGDHVIARRRKAELFSLEGTLLGRDVLYNDSTGQHSLRRLSRPVAFNDDYVLPQEPRSIEADIASRETTLTTAVPGETTLSPSVQDGITSPGKDVAKGRIVTETYTDSNLLHEGVTGPGSLERSGPQKATGQEVATGSRPEPGRDTRTQTERRPQIQTSTESLGRIQTDGHTVLDPQTDRYTRIDTQTDRLPGTETQTDRMPGTATHTQRTPETETQTDIMPGTETQTHRQPGTDTQADRQPRTETHTDRLPELETHTTYTVLHMETRRGLGKKTVVPRGTLTLTVPDTLGQQQEQTQTRTQTNTQTETESQARPQEQRRTQAAPLQIQEGSDVHTESHTQQRTDVQTEAQTERQTETQTNTGNLQQRLTSGRPPQLVQLGRHTESLRDALSASPAQRHARVEPPHTQGGARGRQGRRGRRQSVGVVPPVLGLHTVEVLFVADHKDWLFWLRRAQGNDSLAISEMRLHYAFIGNSMDLRYKSVSDLDPDIHIDILVTGLVVTKTARESPWTEQFATGLEQHVDAQKALDAFGDWVKRQSDLPPSDHWMLFTGYNLQRRGNAYVAGLATLEAMCTAESISIIEQDNTGAVGATAAHELGHSLSARHDGQRVGCSDEENYVMSNKLSNPRTVSVAHHPWTFSPCSIQSFRTFLTSPRATCTLKSSFAKSVLRSELAAGQVYSADTQCQIAFGNGSYFGRNIQLTEGYESMCYRMYCKVPDRPNLFQAVFPLDKTSCGNGMWCVRGRCVSDSRAPSTPHECPQGDDPYIDCQRHECPVYLPRARAIYCCRTCSPPLSAIPDDPIFGSDSSTSVQSGSSFHPLHPSQVFGPGSASGPDKPRAPQEPSTTPTPPTPIPPSTPSNTSRGGPPAQAPAHGGGLVGGGQGDGQGVGQGGGGRGRPDTLGGIASWFTSLISGLGLGHNLSGLIQISSSGGPSGSIWRSAGDGPSTIRITLRPQSPVLGRSRVEAENAEGRSGSNSSQTFSSPIRLFNLLFDSLFQPRASRRSRRFPNPFLRPSPSPRPSPRPSPYPSPRPSPRPSRLPPRPPSRPPFFRRTWVF